MVVCFHVKEWIMEQWESGYCITALAGANNGSSVVVMSKGKAAKACSSALVYEIFVTIVIFIQAQPTHNNATKLVILSPTNG
jgi:hypothetical protein